jgi:pyruvate dehydrogenase E2 component (dihydrolipoamide acetyltransferase)
MSKKIIAIPSLGESKEVEVIEVCVKPGDKVSADDPIVVLESDKAAMELPANIDGVVEKILVSVGDGVSEGMNFIELEVADQDEPPTKEELSTLSEMPELAQEPLACETKPIGEKNIISVPIPNLGDTAEVEVIEVCIKEGDAINADDPLVVLESDKAAMEVPSPKKGTVIKIYQNLGAQVSEGMQLIDLEIEQEEITATVSETKVQETAPQKDISKTKASNFQSTHSNLNTDSQVYAGPAVRKLAREFGIMLAQVSPSGPKGRILKEDLHRFVKEKLHASNQPQKGFHFESYDINFSQWGLVKEEPLTKFQKSAFKNLHTSWINIPHVTQHDEADITDLISLRLQIQKNRYTKITPLAFFIKAICNVLKDYPLLNSSLSPSLDGIVIKEFINIGVAVDTSYGLIVPSIKNVDQLGILEIAEEINRLSSLAKARKLSNKELQGGTFSVSSLGGIGGRFFTPIINPPEVAILGISKVFEQLKLINNKPIARTILPLSLSYDHRVINGAYAAAFISTLSKMLADTSWIEENLDYG